MNDAAAAPEVKEVQVVTKKAVGRKKSIKEPAATKSPTKVHRTRSSAKKTSVKKATAKRQRQPFPYSRVLKMWQAGKSSMAIAKAVGRFDSKAADPMHSFRVTLTRFHKGVRIDGKIVKLPHRISRAVIRRATQAGKKAFA